MYIGSDAKGIPEAGSGMPLNNFSAFAPEMGEDKSPKNSFALLIAKWRLTMKSF